MECYENITCTQCLLTWTCNKYYYNIFNIVGGTIIFQGIHVFNSCNYKGWHHIKVLTLANYKQKVIISY